jgi:hypothetical protein
MAEQEVVKEASSVVTSENAADFYAKNLGLADEQAPTEAETVKKDSEPESEVEQSEPEAKEEAKKQDPEKSREKLNKRFDKVSKRAQESEAKAAQLEKELQELKARVNPQQQQEQKPVVYEGKPRADQFNDAYEYAEALAEWSAENALLRRDAEEAGRKAQEAEAKKIESWNKKLEKAKEDLPDFDRIVQSSDVIVSDEIKKAILESDVGPQVLYALASDEVFARKLTEMDSVKALKEIGKLEAKFEAKEVKTPKADKQKAIVSGSKAPEPIRPLSGGKVGKDVMIDTNGEFHGTYAQWKAARQAGKVR